MAKLTRKQKQAVFTPEKMTIYKNKGVRLSSLCPWVLMAEEGVVLLKNGAISCSYEFVAPDLDSCSAARINSVAALWNSCAMQLGEGWAFQFHLHRRLSNDYPGSKFTSMTGFLVERQRELNFSYVRSHYQNKYYLTFTYQLPPEIQQKSKGFFYKSSDVQAGSLDMGLFESQLKYFLMETGKIAGIIGQAMHLRRLDSNELVTFLHTSVSLNWHKMVLPDESRLFLDRCITDSDLETSQPLRLGRQYIPILTISDFPSTTVPAMFDALNNADCELRWSIRFMILDREQAIKRIDKAEKKFHSQRKSLGQWVLEATAKIQSTRENSGSLAQETDAATAKAEATMGVSGFGDYISTVQVWDSDLEIAQEKAKYLAGIIGACGFACKEETHNALQAWVSMQPGNVYANTRSLFVSTTNMSHAIPISSVWGGLRRNNFLGTVSGCDRPHVICSTAAGIPFFLSLNIGDVGHHWCSGPTGAGKSTYLSLLEVQWLKYPKARVIIFDKDLSARNLTVSVGGFYVEPGKDRISFHPLRELDGDLQLRWAAEFIECLLAEQAVTITPLMRKAITEALVLLAEKPVEQRNLTGFWNYCDYQDPETRQEVVRDALSPYMLGGQYGNLFDSSDEEGVEELGRWTMFEMGTLMSMGSAAVTPALLYLFRHCEKAFTGNPTLLVLDEAWVFLKNEIFARKISEWLKTLRKKNVFVVFATQELEDAASSPIASTIISQCASKVYLPNEEATTKMVREAYRLFGLDDSEISMLADTRRCRKKRDYFYKSAQGTRLFQLDLDAVQLALLTNSKEDHKILDAIEAKYGRNTGRDLSREILDAKKVDYSHLVQR
ncbi:MAG: AAA family ATPase [Spirochaetaceae bacterium]|nr:AAA family ATPase [Spirochaetaceae bacterium]